MPLVARAVEASVVVAGSCTYKIGKTLIFTVNGLTRDCSRSVFFIHGLRLGWQLPEGQLLRTFSLSNVSEA